MRTRAIGSGVFGRAFRAAWRPRSRTLDTGVDKLSALLAELADEADGACRRASVRDSQASRALLKQRREMARGQSRRWIGAGESSGVCYPGPAENIGCASPGRTVVAAPSVSDMRCSGTIRKPFGHTYVPLLTLEPKDQAPIEIYNSPLSRRPACSVTSTGTAWIGRMGLIMWEAQFGDFVNAAQVIIDQFISSAEDKWKRLSGLGDALLPHGFEGQGPGALQCSTGTLPGQLAAAEDNIQVCQPDHSRAVLPSAASSGAAALAQASGRLHSQEPAAPSCWVTSTSGGSATEGAFSAHHRR